MTHDTWHHPVPENWRVQTAHLDGCWICDDLEQAAITEATERGEAQLTYTGMGACWATVTKVPIRHQREE